MVSKIVSIGDKIDLTKLKRSMGEASTPKQYVSQLLDYLEEDKLKIAMPIENSRVIPLDIGDKYQLCFYTERGLYQCSCEIIDRYKEEKIYVLIIKLTSQLEKYQRRQYYRLECILDMDYRIVHQDEIHYLQQLSQDDFISPDEKERCMNALNQLQTEWYPATITDISGGGARFNSTNFHNKGDKLRINIEFPTSNGTKNYELKATVISSFQLPNRYGYYEIRVEFSEIELEERETIIKYVFEEERKIRKREKGLI
jgi:c-di-GMP-binding flagellar brake protein YcgR